MNKITNVEETVERLFNLCLKYFSYRSRANLYQLITFLHEDVWSGISRKVREELDKKLIVLGCKYELLTSESKTRLYLHVTQEVTQLVKYECPHCDDYFIINRSVSKCVYCGTGYIKAVPLSIVEAEGIRDVAENYIKENS